MSYQVFKTGKLPAQPTSSDFKLLQLLKAPLPTAPSRFGFGLLYGTSGWKMLGNDRVGDCVLAGGAHETMLFNKIRKGHDILFDDAVVLGDYSAITGYDPVTGENDDGTYVKDAMSYRRNTGLLAADFSGRHKIDAYVSIDPKNFDLMMKAVYAFGTVGVGFEVPDTDEFWNQFNSGTPWSVTNRNASIAGGHYIPIVGSMDSKNECSAITWARRQRLTREFYETYNDEAWVPLSLELLRGGLGLHALDLPTLRAMLASL